MSRKLHGSDTQLFTQYKEDGNDLLKQIITSDESWIHFYEKKKNQRAWFGKNTRKSTVSGPLDR